MRTNGRRIPPISRYSPLALAVALALAPGVSAAFVVSNAGDNGGINPAPGANTGTLRQALVDANVVDARNNCVNPGFGIAFTGAFTIRPSTPLPPLLCNPTIDASGLAVKLEGRGSIACGLDGSAPLTGGNAIVKGLDISGFDTGLCGQIDSYANAIHGNNTGIRGGVNTHIGDGTAASQNHIYANGTAIAINAKSGVLASTPDGASPMAAAATSTAYLTAPVLDFGDVPMGTSSGELSTMLVSSGTGPYTVDTFTDSSGMPICYGGPFLCRTDCLVPGPAGPVGVTLRPGESCTTTAKFDATSLYYMGSFQRQIVINDVSPNRQVITLQANAVAPPPITVAPSAWDFGNVLVGRVSDAHAFTITNPGAFDVPIGPVSVTGDFLVQGSDCGTALRAGASCNAQVVFGPLQQGPASGTVQVSGYSGGFTPASFAPKVFFDLAPTTATASLSGNGTTQAQIQLPTSIDLGAYTIGKPPLQRTVQLSNGGNADLVISTISASAPFTVTTTCPTVLSHGLACDITVRFSAATEGDYNGTLTIVSNGEGGSGAIPLHARTLAAPRPEIKLSAATMGFGERLLGTTSASQRITVTNIGSTPAIFTAITTSNEEFRLTGSTCNVPLLPAATCFVEVAMTPGGFGLRIGRVIFTSNALGSPHTVDVTGSGCRPYMPTGSRTGGTRSNCAP